MEFQWWSISHCQVLSCCDALLDVLYSWKRGSPVINLLFPSIKSFGVVFLVVLGIVQVAQLVTAILANMNLILVYPAISSDWKLMADINYGLTITMDVSMFAFDLFVVLGYLMYLKAVRTAQYPDIQKLQIISRFGIWSCFWLEVYLACFILSRIGRLNQALPLFRPLYMKSCFVL
ncbi:hypothetical protein BCR33DRAFT_524335 [Rhizoclosmatium globosum]|uniref:Uncharacterized protein n=1 Tax=Rhizoclosmatium globosum TaxID=329046 RepID=A0A1Y2CTD2_9FUNG|nr:hypothetical protein BCR33DRAFT_524335 [Rhizoclosmatium globosum]|eukprot:ORY50207.1 hypothetical protein BCR33DRAFT_524335 [Rhizoclosmatium globosum]